MIRCVLFVTAAVLCVASAAAQAPRAVNVLTARGQEIERKALLQAEVLPMASMRLVPRVSGQIRVVHVAEGDVVERGGVLVDLDCPDLVAEGKVAEAALVEAAAHVDVAQKLLTAEEVVVKVAEADVEVARTREKVAASAAKLAVVEFDRAKSLLEAGARTREVFDEAQLTLERAKAELLAASAETGAARAREVVARTRLGVRKAELNSAAARHDAAEARLQRCRVELGFATLACPYERGLVTRRHLDAGNLAIADMTGLLEIMDVARVRVRFWVPEVDAPFVKKGSDVRFIAPTGDTSATVSRTARALDVESRRMLCEVDLDNADGAWMPGMLCRAEVIVARLQGAIIIPSRAVVKRGPDRFVWAAAAGDTAKLVPVELGFDLGIRTIAGKKEPMVQVRKGVADGDRVIVTGTSGLENGTPLAITDLGDGS